jgi:abequosyltransferase
MLPPKLSICIGTYNRANFIGETLDSMLVQLEPGVEIVIVDNASSDNTSKVIAQYSSRHPEIHYFRKQENTGFDHNYDEAVKYARGEYCWLMSDDDLLCPGAIAKVLSVLGGEDDLIVVNSEARNADLSVVIESRLMKLDFDRVYREADHEIFFARTAKYLSFVGCFVIRRTYWLSKNGSAYYGTGFIHVGVIFQSPPVVNVRVMAEPLVIARLGNAMWNSVRFEIWMLEWPKLIWSFPDFSDTAKRKSGPREPWRRWDILLKYRALGAYTRAEFSKVWPIGAGGVARTTAYLLSIFPESLANFLVVLYLSLLGKNKARVLYDLLHSPHAGVLSRSLARIMGKKVSS